MAMFCPIIKDNCKRSECLAWKDEQCLIFNFLSLRVEELVPDAELNPTIPNEITLATSEDLAEELFVFAMKIATPDDDDILTDDILESFWESKKINSLNIPEKIEKKIQRVENLAQQKIDREQRERQKKILEPLMSMTAEKLADEIFAFAVEESSFDDVDDEYFPTNDVFQYFWEQKKIDKWDVPKSLELKIERAEKIASDKLNEKQRERYQDVLDKEQAELPRLVSECMKWAYQQGLKKIAQADLGAFLLKKKINVHPETKRNLHTMVNLELKTSKK